MIKAVKLVLFSLFAFLFLADVSVAQKTSEIYAKGELLVKYKNGTASTAARSVNSIVGASVLEEFPELGWQRVKLPENLSVNQAAAFYKESAEIEAAQPNFYYRLLAVPNDARYAELYGLAKISAPAAWDLTTGSPDVVVADIDTGASYNHQDLSANMWRNPNETENNGID
ncbi:MAG: hypothetical protein H0X49_07785, partial [Acidobacteria bacterium]|nr:hypothetical protein [Acidobacteriota bacterium]